MQAEVNSISTDVPIARATRRGRSRAPLDGLLRSELERQRERGEDRLDLYGLLGDADTERDAPGAGVPHWLNPERVDEEGATLTPTPPATRGRLRGLASRFSLSVAEQAALLLALLPLFESRYSALMSFLQDDEGGTWPRVTLLLTVLGPTPASRIPLRRLLSSADAPLLRHQLVLPVEKSGRTSSRGDAIYLRGADTVYAFLTGELTPSHPALTDRGDWLPAGLDEPGAMPDEWRAGADQLRAVCFGRGGLSAPVVLLQGGDGREGLVAQLAAEAGMRVFALNLEALPDDTEDAWQALCAALHLTRLTGNVLLLQNLGELGARYAKLAPGLDARLASHGQPVVALTDDVGVHGCFISVARVSISLSPRERESDVNMIHTALTSLGYPIDAQLDLQALLMRTRIHPGRLSQTLAEADLYRRLRDPDASLEEGDLRRALRARSHQHFGRLAQRIEPRRRLDDLIANERLREQLEEILAAIRHRETVLVRGFGRKIVYGTGVSVLFYGESGTGKSMAAEVLAAELGVDLIRVDLSTVVNKYIGETEKNLSRIFDLASADTGVLLFDEADALFGKRSEVKDAHDRHANIEVSYLLQRLEHYPGLVVLSTNNRGHLDDAFTRRLTFMTRFELPDAELRLKMWRAIWPTQISVASDVDWERLAQRTELTGAGIRNVALLASWLAAEAGRAVTQADIERAIRRELGKTGRLVPQF